MQIRDLLENKIFGNSCERNRPRWIFKNCDHNLLNILVGKRARAALWILRRQSEIMGVDVGVYLEEKIDWSECPLVEIKPGVQGGAPVVRGTRMPVSAIVGNFDSGLSVAEIAEQFEISTDLVEAIMTYAKSHRVAHPV